MILRYGGYSFDDAEVGIQIYRQPVYSPRGRRMWTRHTWIVNGVKFPSTNTAAALTAALLALENAMAIDGQDLVFIDNSGSPTAHGLFSAGTINGVQVVGPVEYPGGNSGVWGMQTEYVNLRSYRVKFQADVFNPQDDLVFYHESITRLGTGGPSRVWQESFIGLPQLQTPKLYTKCSLIQQGNAIGLSAYPDFPNPLYGDPFFKHEPAMRQHDSPLRVGINFTTHYPIRWRFVHEAGTAI